MKEFDYIILGGGCAGLSLAYELDINKKIDTIVHDHNLIYEEINLDERI